MAIETRNKTIDGMKITVSQFPGVTGFKMQAKLLKYFSPLLAIFKSGDGEASLLDREINLDSVMQFSESLCNDGALEFVFELLQLTRIDGVEMSETLFNEKFAGKLPTMYKILWFVLEVNFKSFLDINGIGKILSGIIKTNSVPENEPGLIRQ